MLDHLPEQSLTLLIAIINLYLLISLLRESPLVGQEKIPILLWTVSLIAFYAIQLVDRFCFPSGLMNTHSYRIWSITIRLQGALAVLSELLSYRSRARERQAYRELMDVISRITQ
jgi:hypothetical protein